MAINGRIEYSSPTVQAAFDDTFTLAGLHATEGLSDGTAISLEPAAAMYAFWRGLTDSMPQVPVVAAAGTKIQHPGYQE
jgi:hypothetical protein